MQDRKREREESPPPAPASPSHRRADDVIFFAPSAALTTQRLEIVAPVPERRDNASPVVPSSRITPHREPLEGFRAPEEERHFVRGTTPADLVRHMINRTTPDSQLLSKVSFAWL